LLGCATNVNWKFLGTDIEKRSIEYATKNVENNKLKDRITIKYNPDPNRIFMLEEDTIYTFSMCNPPFYSSQEEIEQGLLNKEMEPSAVSLSSIFSK
jgi:23S rRNA A1618 N6-methylase RlmF